MRNYCIEYRTIPTPAMRFLTANIEDDDLVSALADYGFTYTAEAVIAYMHGDTIGAEDVYEMTENLTDIRRYYSEAQCLDYIAIAAKEIAADYGFIAE